MDSPQLLSGIAVALLVAGLSAPSARADDLFVGSQAGMCCFNVDLQQIDPNNMQVTVSLTSGAQAFVDTGSGQHPGFAFNLAGDPTISISGLSSPWVASDVHLTSVVTNGPALGMFDYSIDTPGPGGSQHNGGPLVFDITDASGISFSSFIANSSGNFFAADIQDAQGATGMSAINTVGTVTTQGGPGTVAEPTSLALLGTGIVAAAGLLRRRLTLD